jgi:membrane associated rhomboid family serine protease
MVLPLKDENPTHRTPFVTVAIILACLWVYFAWQPSLGPDQPVDVSTPLGVVQFDAVTAFNYQNAAIPCEVIQGRPLTIDELVETFESQALQPESCGVGGASAPPVFPDKSVWVALFTSMFLHGSLIHLGSNLLFLWIFGNNIEDHLGHLRFALFYVVGGLVASAAHVALNLDSTIPVVGASGAIAAVMGAYLVWFPNAPVRTLVFFFLFVTMADIRAKWLLGIWFVTQFFTNPNSGVAWAAHVGGFVFGVLVGLMIRTSRGARRAAWTPDYRTDPHARWDTTGGVGYHPYRSRRLGRPPSR